MHHKRVEARLMVRTRSVRLLASLALAGFVLGCSSSAVPPNPPSCTGSYCPVDAGGPIYSVGDVDFPPDLIKCEGFAPDVRYGNRVQIDGPGVGLTHLIGVGLVVEINGTTSAMRTGRYRGDDARMARTRRERRGDALDLAFACVYEPGRLDGVPVRVRTSVVFRFAVN